MLNSTSETALGDFDSSPILDGAEWSFLDPPGDHPPFPKPRLVANLTLPTAFEDHSLNVLVVKIPIRLPIPGHERKLGHITKVLVNGQPVSAFDGPALNGALHVVDKLISPHSKKPKPHSEEFSNDAGDDDWEDWENWLLEWADN